MKSFPIHRDVRRVQRGQFSKGVSTWMRSSRHLDGELRVSLSRGRLTRWPRSGFSDGELLCSFLVPKRVDNPQRGERIQIFLMSSRHGTITLLIVPPIASTRLRIRTWLTL